MTSALPILSSIAALADTSEAWIVDIWGVMHNGARAHPAAGEACRRFRAKGGIVVLLSNAPRPFSAVVPHMTSLGVDPDAYDTGVTSGDATREMIARWQGRRLLHIGPERDRGLFEGYDVRFSGPETAEIAVCSGLYDDAKETPADYAGLFESLLARQVPMICANPDILVERGAQLIYCAGALAADYAARGGRVTYAGKPHGPIYDRTLREIARLRGRPVAKENILCIGDGVDTDLKGAHNAGLRSAFIASPIFLPTGLSPPALAELFAGRPFAPVAALPALAW
ncbi:MAG: TIGR01459 family HAD-type hydrolase [Hyphomonadaceae bacterium]|jgi:HAD superfamily hydrolase (TIGR01459 family)|nr:TIGR01459 family HAD-type hydrolase [Hyphomonadaceae bacterium]